MPGLKIAADLTLPIEAAVQTFSILAARGAGKSNTAVVMAEEMHKAGIHWIAVDPKGDWWGIQSSADGRSAGLEVPIFGGEHANFPIYPDSGETIATLLVNDRISALVDVSEFTKGEMSRFLLGFFRKLYRLKNRTQPPTHLFLEEVDEYLPQMVTNKIAELHEAGQRLVTKGRQRGIGATCATQRPARFHNDVLTQTGTLIAMRNTAPTERKQVKLWTDYHDASKEIVDSLPGLEDGEAWVVSPHDLGVVKRVKFRRRATLDTGATPEVIVKGKRRPPTLAEIDAPAIDKALADTIERAKAEDPKELRKRVAELERESAEWQANAEQEGLVAEAYEAEIDELRKRAAAAEARPALDPKALEVIEALRASLSGSDEVLATWLEMQGQYTEQIAMQVRGFREAAGAVGRLLEAPVREPVTPRVRPQTVTRATEKHEVGRVVVSGGAAVPLAPPLDGLTGPMQRVVDALAWLQTLGIPEPQRVQVAMVAGYHPRTKGFTNTLGVLRSLQIVEYPRDGRVALIDVNVSNVPEAPPTVAALQEMVCKQVGAARARILQALIAEYPAAIARDELAEQLGYHPRTKGYTNGLGNLRTLGLIEYPEPGMVRALPVLFGKGAA